MLKALNTDENRIPKAVPIKEISFENPFYEGLIYNPPARGVWNIVHTGMLIPEAHQIYVCAQGCLRGVILTAAEMNRMENMSWVSLREQDMWNGEMESRVVEGCSHIVEKMPKHPRCILVYLSCMHLFEGCDFKVIAKELEERFPDIDWVDCYMTPTMRKSATPDSLMQNSLYGPVRRLPKKTDFIGLIGCDHPTMHSCDLFEVFRLAGKEVWEITQCKTYEEYLRLGEAQALVSYLPVANFAGRILTKKLEAPILTPILCYGEKEIESTLYKLAKDLGMEEGCEKYKELQHYLESRKTDAKNALAKALSRIGQTPVAIDYTATPKPLGLARLLLENGFHVTRVYIDALSPLEKEDFEYLKANHPDLELSTTYDPAMRFAADAPENLQISYLCIGQKAAYFTQSSHFVNIVDGGGMYGYDGICRLAELMTDAKNNAKDLVKTISHKGWGCESCL